MAQVGVPAIFILLLVLCGRKYSFTFIFLWLIGVYYFFTYILGSLFMFLVEMEFGVSTREECCQAIYWKCNPTLKADNITCNAKCTPGCSLGGFCKDQHDGHGPNCHCKCWGTELLLMLYFSIFFPSSMSAHSNFGRQYC